jgi:hypothetical protein
MALPKDYQYKTCRSFGHAWEVNGSRSPVKDEVACSLVITLECARCTAIRRDYVGSLGQIEYRTYDMPRDYPLRGWFPRDEWRQLWMGEENAES